MKPAVKFLYDAIMKYSPALLMVLAFVDASLFALPVTTVFILLVLMKETNTGNCILYVLAGTITGSVAGYALGHLILVKGWNCTISLTQSIMDNSIGFSVDLYYKIRELFQSRGVWILLAAPLTPIPYGIFSISSGLSDINFFSFILITTVSHSIKFTFLGYLVPKTGTKMREAAFRAIFQ